MNDDQYSRRDPYAGPFGTPPRGYWSAFPFHGYSEYGYEPGRWVGAGGEAEPADYRGRGPKGYRRSDERILDELCERMSENALLDASDIEVAVKDGEVTLEGTVGTRADKRLAEAIADEVPGVEDVHNRLTIRSAPREARRAA